jgi:hypothetical protein
VTGVYRVRGADPTREPVVGSPLVQRARQLLLPALGVCGGLAAALVVAEQLEPGVLEELSVGAVAALAIGHFLAAGVSGLWELRSLWRRMRRAPCAVHVTTEPAAGESRDWRDALGMGLVFAVVSAAAIVAFDAPVFVCAIGVVVAGRFSGDACTALVLRRRERRLGRRYYELDQGDDPPAVVWTPAPVLPE